MKHYLAPGKELPGLEVTADTAVGLVTLNQLEYFGVKSPWHMAKTAATKLDQSDAPFKQLREQVQRAWDKPRSRRADLYSTYVENLSTGKIQGGTPPVTIFVNHGGTVNEQDGTISFPYTCAAIAIDGETQLEARFRYRDRNPASGNEPFAVTIYHGCSEEKAMQILHDFNRYANPIPETKLGARNSTGGLSQTIETARVAAKIKLNTSGASGTKFYPAGHQQSMFFVTGYALGKKGLDKSAATYLNDLNMPGSPPIDSGCDVALAEMYDLANRDVIGRGMATFLWQVAGVLASEGFMPSTLKWADGVAAHKAPTTAGPGKTPAKLAAIYAALKP